MTPEEAFDKAYCAGKRLPELEYIILACQMTPSEAYYKALDAGKRLPELEYIILADSFYSYMYTRNVIQDRWIEAEDIIMKSSGRCFNYAKYVIKGKLPEKMHNMMLLHAIKDTNDYFVKEYLDYIK